MFPLLFFFGHLLHLPLGVVRRVRILNKIRRSHSVVVEHLLLLKLEHLLLLKLFSELFDSFLVFTPVLRIPFLFLFHLFLNLILGRRLLFLFLSSLSLDLLALSLQVRLNLLILLRITSFLLGLILMKLLFNFSLRFFLQLRVLFLLHSQISFK